MKKRYIVLLAALTLVVTALGTQAAVLNYEATLEGTQEVPPVVTEATGSAAIVIDTDANTLTYSIAFSGLSSPELFAHIHGFADPGDNAGPLHTLPNGSPKDGVWNYTEGQEADILAGRTYINVHSENNSGGEIRGQIVESQEVAVDAASWSRIKRLFDGK